VIAGTTSTACARSASHERLTVELARVGGEAGPDPDPSSRPATAGCWRAEAAPEVIGAINLLGCAEGAWISASCAMTSSGLTLATFHSGARVSRGLMDRTTKILLALIAGGLWANALPHLLGRANAQQGDVCLGVGDCLTSIDGWTAQSSHYLGSIAADMRVLVAAAQASKAHPEPTAPVRPRVTPAPSPAPAKPAGPCISGGC
jgi:hypothetical protein